MLQSGRHLLLEKPMCTSAADCDRLNALARQHKINTIVIDGFASLQGTLTAFAAEVRQVVKSQERMLDRHDADLYKLRQSGVLQ